jgi:hypothetical protein
MIFRIENHSCIALSQQQKIPRTFLIGFESHSDTIEYKEKRQTKDRQKRDKRETKERQKRHKGKNKYLFFRLYRALMNVKTYKIETQKSTYLAGICHKNH